MCSFLLIGLVDKVWISPSFKQLNWSAGQSWSSVTNAVKAMQMFAGLRDTGVIGKSRSHGP